jgi:translation initiation factor 1
MPREPNTRLVYSTGGETPGRPERAPAPPEPARRPGVRIRLERRASGRLATVVSGLPGPPEALADLLRALKSACGTGGTLKRGALELQGDQREAVEASLRERGLASKRAGG